MNLKLTPEELNILTDALISRAETYQVEGVDDQVEASRWALEQLVSKLRTAAHRTATQARYDRS